MIHGNFFAHGNFFTKITTGVKFFGKTSFGISDTHHTFDKKQSVHEALDKGQTDSLVPP